MTARRWQFITNYGFIVKTFLFFLYFHMLREYLWINFNKMSKIKMIFGLIQDDVGIWSKSYILWNESVGPDVWPKNKCRSLWPIFHGPVILPYVWFCLMSWLFDVWTSFIRTLGVWVSMTQHLTKNKCKSLWPIWSSDFALYLEDYLIYEHHTLGLWVSMIRCLT